MNAIAAEPKKKSYSSAAAGTMAAVGSFGIMGIDRRNKINEKNIPHLNVNHKNYAKYIKPGDVLIGSPTTPDQAMKGFTRSLKGFKNIKIGKGFKKSLTSAINNIDPATPLSKMVNPMHSHVEFVLDPAETAFAGGYNSRIDEIAYEAGGKKTGLHYTIVRPLKKGSSKFIPDVVERTYAGGLLGSKNYSTLGAIKSGIKDFIIPKFRTNEKLKSKKILAAESCMTKGHCATLGALASNRTIGGKTAKNILPTDYLRSKEWAAIGSFGAKPKEIKTKFLNKIIFKSPKYIVRGAAATAMGAGVYGATKAVQTLMKTHNQKGYTAEPK